MLGAQLWQPLIFYYSRQRSLREGKLAQPIEQLISVRLKQDLLSLQSMHNNSSAQLRRSNSKASRHSSAKLLCSKRNSSKLPAKQQQKPLLNPLKKSRQQPVNNALTLKLRVLNTAPNLQSSHSNQKTKRLSVRKAAKLCRKMPSSRL